LFTAEPAPSASPESPAETSPEWAPEQAPDPPPPGAPSGRAALATAWRRAAPAVTAFAVARLAGVAVLTLWAHRTGGHPRNLLGLAWDALWYHRIAGWGYGTFIPSGEAPGMRFDDLAFFPLYPMTVRAVDVISPVGSVASALLVAWASAAVAAWGVFAVVDRCYGRRIATATVILWALLPHAIVLSMAYTEAMMTALAAWALYAVVTRRWLTAGVLSVLAGLCRPNAVAVAVAVIAAVLADARQRRRSGRPQDRGAWAAAVVAPLGWAGYVAWVGLHSGHGLRGYFEVQTRWGSTFDFGHYALHYVKHLVLRPDSLSAYVATALCAGAVILLVLAALERMPLPLLAYTAVLVAIALGGANFFSCKPRFLLPAFPLLVPAAATLARARPRAAAVAVVALTGLSLGYGAYLLTVVTVPL
jgi:hypothetical protein